MSNLSKTLSPLQIMSLSLGAIIGFGCFVLPTDTFLPNAGPAGTIIGLVIGALFVSIIATVLSKLIPIYPLAGGVFVYTLNILGKNSAFICGWSLLIGYISIIGINIAAIPVISRYFLPGVFDNYFLYSLFGWKIYADEVALMLIVLFLFSFINYRGVKFAGVIQVILAFALTIGILSLFFTSVLSTNAGLDNLKPAFSQVNGITSSILLVVSISPFLFVGFDTIPQAAEEFSFKPEKARNIMFISIFIGALLYALAMLAVAIPFPYSSTVSLMQHDVTLNKSGWGIAYVSEVLLGKVGSLFLLIAVLGAVLSGINGFFIASTRLLLAMSRNGLAPSVFCKVHNKFKTPHVAILFVTFIAIFTPFAGRSAIGWTVEMSAVGTVIGYFFASICVFKLYVNKPFSRFISLIAALFSILCIFLLLLPNSPALISYPSMVCLAIWMLLGLIVYIKIKFI